MNHERGHPASRDLPERLGVGPVSCAGGYLFEFERRGYLQAGPDVPEVVLEPPDLVRQLHIGVCRGAGPHHIRSIAEMPGRTPPASRYSPDMSKHASRGTDPVVTDACRRYVD